MAFHLGGQPLRIGGVAGDGGLLVAAVGVGGLQPGSCSGVGAAVADRLGPQAGQPPVALLAGAQGVQPLAGDRGGGADLGRQLGRVELLAAGQLAGQVGVGDLVAAPAAPATPTARGRAGGGRAAPAPGRGRTRAPR